MALVLYGIPSCGTVKKARAWLDGRGAAYTFVDFRQAPVEPSRVRGWVDVLGASALKNTSGGSYRALPDDKAGWSEAQWADAMVADPMVIKRPVIERDGAVVGAGFRGTDDELEALLLR
jgi:arsenate reductase